MNSPLWHSVPVVASGLCEGGGKEVLPRRSVLYDFLQQGQDFFSQADVFFFVIGLVFDALFRYQVGLDVAPWWYVQPSATSLAGYRDMSRILQ